MAGRRSPLDALLGAFGDVRGGEGTLAVLLFADLFMILAAYYVLKVVREPLILAGGGAVVKSYAAAGEAVLAMLIVPTYGALANRLCRARLINVATVFFVACIATFYLLGRSGVPVGVAFFLWLGVFNLMVVGQFWSFANDVCDPEQGRRLFPIIAAGGTLGAIGGAQIAGRLLEALGTYRLMLIAAAILVVALALTNWVHRRNARVARLKTGAARTEVEAPIGGRGAWRMLRSERYLLFIALLVMVYNTVNTTGEFLLARTVTAYAEAAAGGNRALEARLIGEFYAGFFTWVNVLTAVLQLFVVSRIFKYYGVRRALVVVPLLAVGGYALIAAVPLLFVIKTAKLVENSTDYSLLNTTRQALFLPTSRAAKYKAKAAIDTFFVRFGDVVSAAIVFVGTMLGLGLRGFAAVNVALGAVWLLLAIGVARRYRTGTA